MVYPGFVLLVGVGLTAIRFQPVRWAGAAARCGLLTVLLCYCGSGLAYWYGNHLDNGERAIARAIADEARPGDAVLFTALTRAPVQYYLEHFLSTPARFFSYPRDMAKHMGNQDGAAFVKQPQLMRDEVYAVEREMETACAPESRVFVVLTHDGVNQALADYLMAQDGGRRLEPLGEFRQAGSRTDVFLWLRYPWSVASRPG
jgi:hypothetical protein